MPLTLAEKRKIWASATPGPLIIADDEGIVMQVVATDGQPVCDMGCYGEIKPWRPYRNNLNNANAQRFADSIHLETLVAALEKQEQWHLLHVDDLAEAVNKRGDATAIVWTARWREHKDQAEAIRAALNSLNDPEAL